MFGTTLLCGIQKVAVKAKTVDGRLLRTCRVTLVHEFTFDIAREIGKEAVAVLGALKSEAVESVKMPIGELVMMGAFVGDGGEAIEVARMLGVKATGKKSKTDVGGPTIALDLEFLWDPTAWVFLGEHCNSMADVVLTKRQLALALDGTTN